MAARLQRHIGRGAAHVVAAGLGILDGLDLGVVLAGRLGEAFADDGVVPDQYAADAGIGRGGEEPVFRQRQARCIMA